MPECLQCGAIFKHKCRVDDHIKLVHDKVKAFSCEECEKSFGRKSHLKRHIEASHQNVKRYECK